MISKILFSVFVVACTVNQITGQELCRPSRVDTLTLTADSTLVWTPPADDNCDINYYLVDVRNETDTEYLFMIFNTSVTLDFLPVCEQYEFTVTPISKEGVEGVERYHRAKMPLPVDADLSVVLFSASPHDVGVQLEWKLEEEWKKCADRYRVSIFDGESENPVDLYVYSNLVVISRLVACTRYQFGIRAIYNMAIEGPFTSTYFQSPADVISAPTLKAVSLGSTTVDLIWEMESYSVNRCPVSALTVDASPYFRISYPVRDQSNRVYFFTYLSGLQADTLYFLNVTATNTAGVSAPTLFAVQTL